MPLRFRIIAHNSLSLLHRIGMPCMSGYDLPMSEIKRFRQLHSRTPGHPEYGETPGVECTTGPLGQGVGNSVGIAVACKMAGARFNTAEHRIFDQHDKNFAVF